MVSFALGVFARQNNIALHYMYLLVVGLVGLTYFYSYIYSGFKRFIESISARSMLYMGGPLSRFMVTYYVTLFQVVGFAAYTVLLVGFVLGFVHGYVPLELLITVALFAGIMAFITVLPKIHVEFAASTRKTSTEIELPFLLLLFRVLGSTHLTLYDLLNAVENSVSLRAWSNEVKNAKKVASVLGTSLATAIGIIADNHPSRVVRDVFKRILTVAVSTGSVKEIVEKAFGHVYAQLEARLSGLSDKLTVINGVLMLGFLFIPIILVVAIPLFGIGPEAAFMLPLVVSTPLFFFIYALVSAYYPSAFVVSPPRFVFYVGILGFAVPMVVALFNAASMVMGQGGLPDYVFAVSLIAPLVPSAILAELQLRRANLYDKLMRLVSDAIMVSSSTGENFATVLERMAPRYGKAVEELAYRITRAYNVELLRREVVKHAPSTFHAVFVESLIYSLIMGSKPEMLKALASSYEYLINVNSKISSIARSQKLMLVGVSGMLSVFLGYIKSLFTGYFNMIKRTGVHGSWSLNINLFAGFNPLVYDVISCSIVVSLLLISLIVGKMRGGSVIYGAETAVALLLVYVLGTLVARFIPVYT